MAFGMHVVNDPFLLLTCLSIEFLFFNIILIYILPKEHFYWFDLYHKPP